MSDFSVISTFRESSRLAHNVRNRFIGFMALLLLVMFGVQALTDSLYTYNGLASPTDTYMRDWIISPVLSQLAMAFIIANVNFSNAVFNQFKMDRPGEGSFFDHFSRLFFVGLAIFYLSNSIFMLVLYPPFAAAQGHFAGIDSLIGFLFYLAMTTSLFFGFLYVLIYNYRPSQAIRDSFRSTAPHWFKVLVIIIAQFVMFSLPLLLIKTSATNLWQMQSFNVTSYISVLLLAAGLLFAYWLLPIVMCTYLITFQRLAIVK